MTKEREADIRYRQQVGLEDEHAVVDLLAELDATRIALDAALRLTVNEDRCRCVSVMGDVSSVICPIHR